MRQKISFILLLLSLSATTLCAENASTQQLVVWLKNGQKVVHDLADKPETRFNAGFLMLTTEKVSISYPLS